MGFNPIDRTSLRIEISAVIYLDLVFGDFFTDWDPMVDSVWIHQCEKPHHLGPKVVFCCGSLGFQAS